MLHFFPHYAKDVSDHPFAQELRRLKVPHLFFGGGVDRGYKTVFGLLFGVYRRLIGFALRSAVRSLLLSRPRPAAAVVGTDIEALIFGAVRWLFRLRTLIVLETLIVTPRRSGLANALHKRYFRLVLSLTDIGVCHSRIEMSRYAKAFPGVRCRYVFVPYGTTVTDRDKLIAAYAAKGGNTGEIVTAGRSSRDYPTLAAAIAGLPCRLRIICDMSGPVAGLEASDQITIDRQCVGWDYIEAVANALFVVVPLSVDELSAGQMVLLQASAMRKAVIITRTSTTPDYAVDGEDALLVDRGDVGQMRDAVRRLLDDRDLRDRIASNASDRFLRDHSTEVYVRNLVAVIEARIRTGPPV
jgi:glycosyltransferase involved in cell wall biosynthesis